MNGILATGFARFDTSGNNTYLSFDYNSTVVGENSGKSLFLFTDALNRNYYNTFLGYKSGENTSLATNNIFIGAESGTYVQSASNNILIGKNYNDNTLKALYDVIAIGQNNNPGFNSIIVGNTNFDTGYDNLILGDNNILTKSTNTIAIGSNNTTLNTLKSIIIGNDNNLQLNNNYLNNAIILGNNIFQNNLKFENLMKSKPLIIGNDINQLYNCNYTINIGNTFCKYDDYIDNEILYFGGNNKYNKEFTPSAFGFKFDEIDGLNNLYNFQQSNLYFDSSNTYSNIIPHSVYVKSGIFTDRLSIGSYTETHEELSSNYSITLLSSSNLTSNLRYVLPDYPHTSDSFLSYDTDGELKWKRVDITNLTTDKVPQGSSNIYYSPSLVDARINANYVSLFQQNFDLKMSQINTDSIQTGSSNRFITNGVLDTDLYVFGTLTVNRLQVIGVDLSTKMTLNEYMDDILQETSNSLFEKISYYDSRLVDITEKDKNMSNYISKFYDSVNLSIETLYDENLSSKFEYTSNELYQILSNIDFNMSNYVDTLTKKIDILYQENEILKQEINDIKTNLGL